MATKKLQGITIEIDGNTTKLSNALKDVNSVIASTSSELKNINSLLKLDPKNTELLSQKQKVLADTISATKEKLEQLKNAQEQMDAKGVDKNTSDYRELTREIVATENKLKALNDEFKNNAKDTDNASKSIVSFGDLLKTKLVGDAIEGAIKGMATLSKQIVGIGKEAIANFGDYEQLVGGIESMFGGVEKGQTQINKVMETGKNAWKELTMSENAYFSTFNSTYPLIKSSMDDENEAIETTNRMLQLESDLANTFGYDMTTASTAVNWALKGTYSYLDNLNIGIKGTKEGFLEASRNAGYMVDSVDELSSSDILDILEKTADQFGVLGKTQAEATETIQGSFKMLTASWQNLLTGLGDANADISELVNSVIESATAVLDNVIPIISNIVGAVGEALPQIMESILNELPSLLSTVKDIILNIIKTITSMLPQIMQMGTEILLQLIFGLVDVIPQLMDSIVETVMVIIDTIANNLDKILEAGLTILITVIEGIINAIPKLIAMLPTIIQTIVETLTQPDMLEKIIQASIYLMFGLQLGIINAIPSLIKALPQIISSITQGLNKLIHDTDWLSIGKNVLKGILNGMLDFGTIVKDTIKKVGNKITSSIKDFFGIHSPSKLMQEEIGKFLPMGIAEGFEKEIPNTINDVENAMSELNDGIQASVNPTINPTANTNPLIIQIENFNNDRETDIQSLAEELEFYRKNSAIAVGGM